MLAGAKADLLLTGGECRGGVGGASGEGFVEVGNCGFLGRRGDRGNDFADAILAGFLLDLENVSNWILELS